jgi:[protein-PII] uridylyltransferase
MLYLLTRADSRATAANMWGDWRASLIREAFVKTLALLESPAPQRLDWRRAEVRQVLARRHAVFVLPEIDRHLDALPPSYLGAFPPAEQAVHFDLMRPPPAPDEVRVRALGPGARPTVIVVARDRPGLLAAVAAAMAVHGIDVLAARAFTRSDGVALQSYIVTDAFGQGIEPGEWDRVRADIGADPDDVAARLDRRMRDYASRLVPLGQPTVRVDNSSSAFYTLVEVRAPDSVGLLARLTRALAALGLDVHAAKIVTEGNEASDTFSVWDATGGPVDHGRFAEVERALLSAASR